MTMLFRESINIKIAVLQLLEHISKVMYCTKNIDI